MEIKGKVHCFFEQSKEEWRDIKGFEGLYQVSNLGRVKSLSRVVRANTCGLREILEKILSNGKSSCGYDLVVLSKNGKHYNKLIHRLVAETFIPNPNKYREVNHKDENKANNFIYVNKDGSVDYEKSNLEWCDRKYNANYGTGIERCAAKKYKPVVMIDATTGVELKTYKSAKDAMKETNINRNNIGMVCLGKRATAGGYIWKFK